MRRNILVTGATGKQGSGLIKYLEPYSNDFHVYAVSQSPRKPPAEKLASKMYVTIVQGDLDDKDSIAKIFDDIETNGGVWAVFVILPYPGLGKSTEGEERQGKMLTDLALHYHVSCFIYSSLLRYGPKYDSDLGPHQQSKASIEKHIISLTDKGLPWTEPIHPVSIIRPAFFMENFEGFIGSIGVSVFTAGLKKDTQLTLVASEDIGKVGVEVLKRPEEFKHQILTIFGDLLTMSQLAESYKHATGKTIPSVPSVLAWSLLKINKGAQDIIKECEKLHYVRTHGEYPELEAERENAKKAGELQTYHDWVKHRGGKKTEDKEWNKLSFMKLVTGQS